MACRILRRCRAIRGRFIHEGDASSMTQTAWRHARNMLCIRLDYLGDVLMCTPAMRALKDSIPQCRLTLLTSSGSAAAARMIAEIDAVIEYAAPWMKSSG